MFYVFEDLRLKLAEFLLCKKDTYGCSVPLDAIIRIH